MPDPPMSDSPHLKSGWGRYSALRPHGQVIRAISARSNTWVEHDGVAPVGHALIVPKRFKVEPLSYDCSSQDIKTGQACFKVDEECIAP